MGGNGSRVGGGREEVEGDVSSKALWRGESRLWVWRWLWVDVDELYICGCVSGCVGVYGVFLIIIFTRES